LHDPTLPISHVAIMMSLETMIDHDLASGMDAKLGFRLGEASYVANLHQGRLDVERRAAEDCRTVFSGTPAQLAAVIYGGAPLSAITVEGDLELARRFVTLFPLPPKAG
jgi:hypothetical protein